MGGSACECRCPQRTEISDPLQLELLGCDRCWLWVLHKNCLLVCLLINAMISRGKVYLVYNV